MFAVQVSFKVDPSHFLEFSRRVIKQAEDSLRLEPECRVFEVWTCHSEKSTIQLWEVYERAEAFENHIASEHFAEFSKDTAAWIMDKNITRWDKRLL